MTHARPALFLALVCSPALAQAPTLKPGWPQALSPSDPYSSPILVVDLDGDPELELIVGGGLDQPNVPIHAFDPDGSPLPGWPLTLSHRVTSTAAGDLDGDGDREVVLASGQIVGGPLQVATLSVYHHDGTPVAGFPISYPEGIGSPVLGDIDGDGDVEIVVRGTTPAGHPTPHSVVHLIQGDGSPAAGWPRSLPDLSHHMGAPTIGDVDGDGQVEVVVSSQDQVHAWRMDGTSPVGFPCSTGDPLYLLNGREVYLADLDDDGDLELVGTGEDDVWFNGGEIFAFDHTGSPLAGWSAYSYDGWKLPLSIADLDADGDLEVIAFGSDAWGFSLRAFDHTGSWLPGFPASVSASPAKQPSVADLDGDGAVEIVLDGDSLTHGYLAVEVDGTTGWGSSFLGGTGASSKGSQLNLDDLDADGLLELAAVFHQGSTSSLYVYDTSLPTDPEVAPLATYRHGHTRSGSVGAPLEARVHAYGCGTNPAGSLTVAGGDALPGSPFDLAIQDPTGTRGPGLAVVAVAGAPDPAFPCGTPVPGVGLAGGAGEVLVALAPAPLLLGPVAYTGPGTSSTLAAAIPTGPGFIGLHLYLQGVLVDPAGLGVTNGLDVRVGH